MKKKIQKYLAGEREGFSLVELIIVIAIMAILIGVIALAVIPNIQRSRESKDLSALDGALSGLNVAAANAKLATADYTSGDLQTLLTNGKTASAGTFAKEAYNNLGETAPTPNSSAAKENSCTASYYSLSQDGDGKAVIKVWYGKSDGTANTTDYDSSEASQFLVQN